MSKNISRINPTTLPNSKAMGYSQISIVESGRTAYVSGQVAWQANNQPVPSDLVDQMRIVAKNSKAALDAMGAKPEDIAIARCFMVNLTPERLEQLFAPLLEFFDGSMPCITGVGVAALAAPDLQVELELTVRLPD